MTSTSSPSSFQYATRSSQPGVEHASGSAADIASPRASSRAPSPGSPPASPRAPRASNPNLQPTPPILSAAISDAGITPAIRTARCLTSTTDFAQPQPVIRNELEGGLAGKQASGESFLSQRAGQRPADLALDLG